MLRCPGIRNQEIITFLECILNQKEWSQNQFCQTYLQLNQDGSTSKLEKINGNIISNLMEQTLNYVQNVQNLIYQIKIISSQIIILNYNNLNSFASLKVLIIYVTNVHYLIAKYVDFNQQEQYVYYVNGIVNQQMDNVQLEFGIKTKIIVYYPILFLLLRIVKDVLQIIVCIVLNMFLITQQNLHFTVLQNNIFLNYYFRILFDLQIISINNKYQIQIFCSKILLLDIKVINCFSFLNQIIKVQFSSKKNKKQFKLKILNITIIFKKSARIRYFEQFGQFTEITEINRDNGMFNIIGGQVMIDQFIIQVIILSQIFQIINSNKILMKNVYISDFSALYQLPLIFINQQLNLMVILQNIMIQRFSINQMNYIEENIQQYVVVECQLKKLILVDDYSSQNFIKQNIQLLQQQSTKIGYPLIQFISQVKTIRSVKLTQINCQNCSKGILFFHLNIFNYVKINEFLCIYNSIKENGCLHFKGNSQNYNKKVTVCNSDFILNKGSQGGAIMAEKQYYLQADAKQLEIQQASQEEVYMLISINMKLKQINLFLF
ncbi:unnamed protein product [Paramecium pentaurelia]|uniref:Uncharacterized protein n=1 Tax=Paramecium pentaurelia TaxID=43138 RepID=A0A8S1UUV0_9CILI|nr:unnamed protein product [Paramecium pentaurelia]